ncbi:ABC transporter substrate-binding protein [Subtercola boreus]|uniref:ABC transporter substrate-binding protein n=1 Tax=Subtercola boreus TaxID=120213 RepID=UPI001C0EDAB7|nr:extracellular solute-binding protein [Subtercola boreus]
MITTAKGRLGRIVPAVAIIGTGALLLAGCASGSAASGSATGSAKFDYLGADTNTEISTVLTLMSKDQCSSENTAQPLSVGTTPGTGVDQKLQLLAGQNALPAISTASGTPSLMTQFVEAKKIVNITEALGDESSNLLPAAQSIITKLCGGSDSYVLPTEFNIEGIWYNKKIFADNGITVPETWDALVAASQKLEAAGVQPITADGKDGWPITRLIGNYIFRDQGADALQAVKDGSAKLTDAAYVKAADAVAALGQGGAFGPSVGSIDYNGMENAFLTGGAAMMYNGSWTLANFNDPAQNTIGLDNIAYMPFPAVTGGKGSIDDTPANIGIPVMLGQSSYGTNTQAWIKCIAANYGDLALANGGVVSGFKVTNVPTDLPALTQVVQAKVAATTTATLWFEALFSPKQTTVSQNNAALLATGSLTGEQFMQMVQDAGQ